ncbi:hypothetical protein FD64_15130, partial [Staphylococcus aureus]
SQQRTASTARALRGKVLKGARRHEGVERPIECPFAGLGHGGRDARRGWVGVRGDGAAGAVGVQAAGSCHAGDGEHHLVSW